MIIIFPSQVHQPRNQEVEFGVAVTKQTDVKVVQGNCSLRLNNGTNQTQVTADAGDTISLVFTTKGGYANKDTFEFEVNGERSFFVYCTEDDPSQVFDPYYMGKSFLDKLTNPNGSSVDYLNDNTLEFFTPEGPVTVDLTKMAEPGTPLSSNQTYMLDSRNGEIYKIDVDNRLAVKKLSLGSPAVGMSVTKSSTSNDKVTWMTLTDGRVVCVNDQEEIVQQLAINGVGTGIDTSIDGRLVVICDTTANQVFIYENMGGDVWQSAMLPGTGYPYDTFVDSQKNIWVSSKLGDKMMVFPFGSRLPIEIDVGEGQKTVKQVNDRTIGIVCTETNEIVMIDTRTKAVRDRVSVPYPVDFAVIDKTVYIANAQSEVLKMDLTGSNVSGPISPYLPAMPTIYSLDSDKNTKSLIVAKMYGNTPNMLYLPSRVVSNVGFEGPANVFTTKKYTSDTARIQGIDVPVEVYTPANFDLNLTVTNNGVINTSRMVSAEGTVKFEFQPEGNDKEKIVFPILIGNFVTYFESELKIPVADLKPFRFHNAMLTDLSVPYASNEVVIAGLLEGQTTEFAMVKSNSKISVHVNGIATQAPVMVKNGDRVQLHASFAEEDFDNPYASLFLRATCEDLTTNWQILLVSLMAGEVVTKPYTKGIPLQSLNWDLGSWREISVYGSNMNKVTSIRLWPEDITGEAVAVGNETLVCDYSQKQAFVIDSSKDTAAFASEVLEAGPYAAKRVGSNIFVSLPDVGKILVMAADLQVVNQMNLTYAPYGLEELNGQLVVAGENGKLHFYNPTTLATAQEAIQLNGALTDVVKFGEDLLISDFGNSKIKLVRNGFLHKTYEVGGNPTRIAVDAAANKVLVVNNYDNSVSEINLATDAVTTTALARPVHDAVAYGGKWRVIDMQTTSVIEGLQKDGIEDASKPYVTKTLKQNSGLVTPNVGGKLYVMHLASEYLNILEERVYATSDDFIPQLKVSVRTPLTSNHVTFNYMSRPQLVSVPPDSGYNLVFNGVEVGTQALVQEGDTIAIMAMAPRHFSYLQEVLLSGAHYVKPFTYQTVPNYIPTYIRFETIFGTLPGEWVTSNEALVEGLSDDNPIDISVSDKYVLVYVNGELVKDLGSKALVKVKNGDRIQLKWEVERDDNALAVQHTLTAVIPNVKFASWNIYQLPLEGVADLSVFVNWSLLRYQFGEAIVDRIKQVVSRQGATPETIHAKILEVLGAGGYVSQALTLFADAYSPLVPLSNIWTASPYVGAVLTQNKSFYGKLNGPELLHPTTYYGKLNGPDINLNSTTFYGSLAGPTVGVAPKFFTFDYAFQATGMHIEFANTSVKLDSNPKVAKFGAEAYQYSINAPTQKIEFAEPLRSFDFSMPSLVTAPRTNDAISVEMLPYSFGGTIGVDYELVFYTMAFDNLAVHKDFVAPTGESQAAQDAVATIEGSNVAAAIDITMMIYTSSDGPQRAIEYSVPIVPDPVPVSIAFSWFPTIFLGVQQEAIAHATPQTYYGKVEIAGVVDSNTYYGRLEAANYNNFKTVLSERQHTKADFSVHVLFEDITGITKFPTTYTKVAAKSTFVMQVELAHQTDQTNISATDRGAYTEQGVQDFIDTDVIFEPGILNKYQLNDGTWMYYHLNRLKYGECVIHQYIVDHGLVRGG